VTLRRGKIRRIVHVASAGIALVLLAACKVDLSTTVTVAENGSGSIVVVARADAAAVAAAPELATSLNLDDLRAAGWEVDVVSPAADGGLTVTVSRAFANTDEATTFLSQLSGESGPLRNLSLKRTGSTNDARYSLGGQAGLPQGLAGFADSEALAVLGTAPFAASLATQGVSLDEALIMNFTVTMPGAEGANNATSVLGADDGVSTSFSWMIPVDQSELVLSASTRDRDVSAMLASYAAQAFLVLMILLVAGAVMYIASVAYRRKSSTPTP
jgi:hypothetical protein